MSTRTNIPTITPIGTRRRRSAAIGALALSAALLTACGANTESAEQPGVSAPGATTPATENSTEAPAEETAEQSGADSAAPPSSAGAAATLVPDDEILDGSGQELEGRAAAEHLVAVLGEADETRTAQCDDDTVVLATWGDLVYGYEQEDDDDDDDAFWTLGDGSSTPALPEGLALGGDLGVDMTYQEVRDTFEIDDSEGNWLEVDVDADNDDEDYDLEFAGTDPDASIVRIGEDEGCDD